MTIAFLAALLSINVALRALPVRRHGQGALTAVECAFLRGGSRAAVLAVLATQHVRGDIARSVDDARHVDDHSDVDDHADVDERSDIDDHADVEEQTDDDTDDDGDGDIGRDSDAETDHDVTDHDEAFDLAVLEAGDPPTGTWGIARSAPVRAAAAVLRERLVSEGLLAPTGHWFIARCALLGVPVVAALAVLNQPLHLPTVLGALIALVASIMLWLAPRRTVAGWRTLRAERRRYVRVTLAEQGPVTDVNAVGMLVALHGQPALEVVTQRVPLIAPGNPSGDGDGDAAPSPLAPRRLTL